MSTSALITGITGQDGSYLAELLLEKGYEVHGMVRRSSTETFQRLAGFRDDIVLHTGDLLDQRSLGDVLKECRPDEIYNLAAMSFVAASWSQPVLTAEFTAFTCPEGDDAAAQVDDQSGEALITCDRDGLKYLLSPAVIEGTSLTDASAGLPQATPQWVVNLELDGEGSDVFSTVTRGLVNTQQLFAIVLDGQVLSAPEVTSPITNGQAQISGGFTQETATDLANSLQYGALPLTFDESGVTLAGPTLAGSQLAAGVLAGLIGLALVVVYCMFYYRGLGLVVIASLAVAGFITYELVLLLGASVGFTLTLPGIAGLIVAVGITADSFIVFFERLRDEVREGKSLRLAVEAGWRRARLTILAADAVSLLAAVVLYIFAIDEIRGFAFALGLTTAIDVLVVFFFTKPLVSVLARTKFFGQGHPMSGLDARHLGVEGRKVSELAHGARRPARVPR